MHLIHDTYAIRRSLATAVHVQRAENPVIVCYRHKKAIVANYITVAFRQSRSKII